MSLKYNNTNVSNLKYNNTDVKMCKFNGTVVWTKTQSLSITLNTGVASITVSYYDAMGQQTTSVVNATTTLNIYANTSWSWTATPRSSYVMSTSSGGGTGSGSINPTAIALSTISVTKNTGVASITLTYVDINGTSQTISNASGNYTARAGTNYSWTATASTSYVMDSSSGSGTTSTTAGGSVSVSPTTYALSYLTATINAGVFSIVLQYVDSSGNSATQMFKNIGGTVTVKAGTSYSWIASASSGYTMDSSSGSGTTSTTAGAYVSVSPTAHLSENWTEVWNGSRTITFGKNVSGMSGPSDNYTTSYIETIGSIPVTAEIRCTFTVVSVNSSLTLLSPYITGNTVTTTTYSPSRSAKKSADFRLYEYGYLKITRNGAYSAKLVGGNYDKWVDITAAEDDYYTGYDGFQITITKIEARY